MLVFALVVAANVVVAPSLPARTFSYCDEKPTKSASMSYGTPSNGRVEGAEKLEDDEVVRVLPERHKARCLSWGTRRLVRALARAGDVVAKKHPGSPPLGVGNIGRAKGGPIREFSRSHHAGRDADIAFYLVDDKGKPVAANDLVKIGDDLRGLDVPRTWTLVQTLVEDSSIDIRWLFVSNAIKRALLDEGKRVGAAKRTLRRADEVLHQPSDAPPHDDHLHLRIRCTASEVRVGCRDG